MQKSSTVVTLGKRIKMLREAANIKQVDLAKAAGVSTVYLGMLERGERDAVTVNILENLAIALNIPLNSLFEGIGLHVETPIDKHVDRDEELSTEEINSDNNRYVSNLTEFIFYLPLIPQEKLWKLVVQVVKMEEYPHNIDNYILNEINSWIANFFPTELALVKYIIQWHRMQRDYFAGEDIESITARKMEICDAAPDNFDAAYRMYQQKIDAHLKDNEFLFYAEQLFVRRANKARSYGILKRSNQETKE